MQNYAHVVFALLCLSILLNCNGPGKNNSNMPSPHSDLKEPLIEANQKIVRNESLVIDSYIERNNLTMTETGTGLRYMIYEKGNGPKAEVGKQAMIKFKVYLLDGTLCYSSEEKGPEEFMIGQANKESGLHEGIQYMHTGDKAKMILPSHLAHGMVGDDNKIPSRAIIIYDVELLSIR